MCMLCTFTSCKSLSHCQGSAVLLCFANVTLGHCLQIFASRSCISAAPTGSLGCSYFPTSLSCNVLCSIRLLLFSLTNICQIQCLDCFAHQVIAHAQTVVVPSPRDIFKASQHLLPADISCWFCHPKGTFSPSFFDFFSSSLR